MTIKRPIINAFPEDDVLRVVWAYGCVMLNTSNSTNPLVKIALRELVNGNVLDKEAVVRTVTIAELDIVRLGSIWKGQKSQGQVHKDYKKAFFNFDFTENKPEVINLFDEFSDGHYYIPPFKYNIKSIKKSDRYTYFSSAKLTWMTTKNGVDVFIPSLEMFTSTYTPHNKEIRRRLITNDLLTLLDRYIDLSKSMVASDEKYKIILKSNKFVSNIVFLAYVALNSVTRERVSKIWAGRNQGIHYFPEVEPYQPEKLSIEADGLWLDKDKSSFLVMRVNGCSVPDEHDIEIVIPEGEAKEGGKVDSFVRLSTSTNNIEEKLPIDNDTDPGHFAGIEYIISGVELIGNEPKVRIAKEKYTTEKTQHAEVESSVNTLSSGEQNYTKDSESTALLRAEEPDELADYGVLRTTYDALKKIKEEGIALGFSSDIYIQSLHCYCQDGFRFQSFISMDFHKALVGKKGIRSWPKMDGDALRKALLCQVVFSSGEVVFILEIERKLSERFRGLAFTTDRGSLSREEIFFLLETIAFVKGKFTYRVEHPTNGKRIQKEIDLPPFLIDSLTFDHKKILNSEMLKIKKVLDQSIERFL